MHLTVRSWLIRAINLFIRIGIKFNIYIENTTIKLIIKIF